eukprot:s9_g32.t1
MDGVICLTAPKNTAVLPCRHFCCCYDCALALRFNGAGRKRCPLCRSQVTDILRLDMAELEEVVPEALPESGLAEGAFEVAGAEALPPSASRRLSLELRTSQRRGEELRAEHQLELSLAEEGDLRLWRMLLYTEGFGSSTLGHELRRWKVEAVELELWIPQSFPQAPPVVRVMRPRFQPGSFWVQEHGALCMEVLSHNGWSPALSLAQLGVQIKDLLVSGTGHLTNAGSMALPGLAARQRAMQVTQRMEQVELFSFLSDKDLFAEIYRNQLSKRLLYETSASEDAEKSMIAKLKMKCGAQFTSKLEGMLTDLSLALDTQKDFKDHCEQLPEGKGALGNIDFNVTVLTTGFWPSYQVQEASLCPEMQKAIQVFSNYYNGKTQHRRLQWIHHLGQATIAAKLNGRRHDLIVNSYQALILLLFTRDEGHNLSFIQNSTGLEPSMCKKLLATLSIAKFKILTKTGDAKTIEDTGWRNDDATFTPNDGFVCQHRKIKIPPPVTEETHNKERVEEDRSIAIEAAIVRIMKMRKTPGTTDGSVDSSRLNHQQLVTEVLTQLAFFKPNPKLVKQRIEHLIEREYLERDKDQASKYRYLA